VQFSNRVSKSKSSSLSQ